jgi:hypothetical protein
MEANILSNHFKTNLYNLLNVEGQNKVYNMNNFLHICGLNLKINEIKYKELSDMCVRGIDEKKIKNIYEKLSTLVNSKGAIKKKSHKKTRKKASINKKTRKKASIKRKHSMIGGGGVKFIEYLKKVNKIFTDNIDKDIFENIKDNIEQTDESLINEKYLRTIISINNVSKRGGGYNAGRIGHYHLHENESPDFIKLLVIIVLFIFLVDIFSGKNRGYHGGADRHGRAWEAGVGMIVRDATRVWGRRRTSVIITLILCICTGLLCGEILLSYGFSEEVCVHYVFLPFCVFCFNNLIYHEELQSELHNYESLFRTDREWEPPEGDPFAAPPSSSRSSTSSRRRG